VQQLSICRKPYGTVWSIGAQIPHLNKQEVAFNMTSCSEFDRLDSLVEDVLGNLAQLATLELDRFQAGDYPTCRKLEQELVNTVGEKERAFGALRQHVIEHKCQQGKPI
jgi:hypothetical protein